jgi:hypothetical protein
MNRTAKIVIPIIAVAALFGCKHSTQSDPWPVWILYVTPVEAVGFSGTHVPISQCATVVWRYSDSQNWNNQSCYPNSNYVKVWNSLTQETRIFYYVRCTGYYDSGMNEAFFLPPARQGQGRPGAEVIVNQTVVLSRQ